MSRLKCWNSGVRTSFPFNELVFCLWNQHSSFSGWTKLDETGFSDVNIERDLIRGRVSSEINAALWQSRGWWLVWYHIKGCVHVIVIILVIESISSSVMRCFFFFCNCSRSDGYGRVLGVRKVEVRASRMDVRWSPSAQNVIWRHKLFVSSCCQGAWESDVVGMDWISFQRFVDLPILQWEVTTNVQSARLPSLVLNMLLDICVPVRLLGRCSTCRY